MRVGRRPPPGRGRSPAQHVSPGRCQGPHALRLLLRRSPGCAPRSIAPARWRDRRRQEEGPSGTPASIPSLPSQKAGVRLGARGAHSVKREVVILDVKAARQRRALERLYGALGRQFVHDLTAPALEVVVMTAVSEFVMARLARQVDRTDLAGPFQGGQVPVDGGQADAWMLRRCQLCYLLRGVAAARLA